METILILTLVFIVAFNVGRWTERLFHRMILRDLLKDLGVTQADLHKLQRKLERDLEGDESTPEAELIPIRIEQHHGQLYAYRKDTEQFVGQSTTSEGLQREIRSRFRDGVRFIVAKSEGGDLLKSTP